jgi:hypothetical protein
MTAFGWVEHLLRVDVRPSRPAESGQERLVRVLPAARTKVVYARPAGGAKRQCRARKLLARVPPPVSQSHQLRLPSTDATGAARQRTARERVGRYGLH